MVSAATKDFVAATLSSGPAARGNVTSQIAASGLVTSLTRATVMAPAERAMRLNSVRSSLCPDCEIVSTS